MAKYPVLKGHIPVGEGSAGQNGWLRIGPAEAVLDRGNRAYSTGQNQNVVVMVGYSTMRPGLDRAFYSARQQRRANLIGFVGCVMMGHDVCRAVGTMDPSGQRLQTVDITPLAELTATAPSPVVPGPEQP